MIVQRPLRHHRRSQRHAESGLCLRVRLGASGPGLQLRPESRAEEPSDGYRRDAETHCRARCTSRCAPRPKGRCRRSRGAETAHLRGQAPRRQRRRADPPRGPGEQGRGGVDGQHPGSGHHRPPVQRRPRRHDEDHRRGRLGDRAVRSTSAWWAARRSTPWSRAT